MSSNRLSRVPGSAGLLLKVAAVKVWGEGPARRSRGQGRRHQHHHAGLCEKPDDGGQRFSDAVPDAGGKAAAIVKRGLKPTARASPSLFPTAFHGLVHQDALARDHRSDSGAYRRRGKPTHRLNTPPAAGGRIR